MATELTPEDAARRILQVFADAGSRAGDAKRGNNFQSAFAAAPWRGSDFAPGREYALAQGWIELGNAGALKLTEAGFREM